MTDLDQELRDLLRAQADTVGPPPPLPGALRGVSRSRWWTRQRQWLLVPAVMLITGAVVVPVALLSQDNGETAMPAQQARAWADQVCTTRPSERSPSQDEVRSMSLMASAICWWENPANLGDDTVGLQGITSLTSSQVADLQGFLTDSPRQQPTCSMIDSPPQVEYNVFLRDANGQDWRIDIPEPPCLGFTMASEHYLTPPLVNWLGDLSQATQPTIEAERPSEVAERAEAVLGDRFVDLSVGPDQASYVIGVLNLQKSEVPDLTSELERQVPLHFVQRTVSASDVDDLRRIIAGAFADNRQGVRVIGSNPANGTVLVGVASDGIPRTADAVAALLPGPQSVTRTPNGTASVCPSDADPSRPCVLVKAVGVGELTND